MDIEDLSRREVRYWCFRFRQEASDGGPARGAPPGLRARFEAMEWFGGWHDFAVKWDVDKDDPWRIVPRAVSVDQEWDRQATASLAKSGRLAAESVTQAGASDEAGSAASIKAAKKKYQEEHATNVTVRAPKKAKR